MLTTEANIIADAMFEFALVTNVVAKNDEDRDKFWQGFIEFVKDGGWEYLNNMSTQYRKRPYLSE